MSALVDGLLRLAGLPEAEVAGLEDNSPRLARVVAALQKLEPDIKAADPHIEALVPIIARMWPVIEQEWPDLMAAAPSVLALVQFFVKK